MGPSARWALRVSLPDLERSQLDSFARRALVEDLRCLPWAWPTEQQPELLARARELSGQAGPAVAVGQVLLLTVDASGGAAWAAGQPLPAGRGAAPLASEARQAWARAARALPRSLPFLWSTLHAKRELPIVAPITLRPGRARTLDGRSFGLSFLLCLASRMLGQPVGREWAATAAVEDTGRLGPVEGLAQKIEALRGDAPQVRNLVVHASQAAEASAAVAEGHDLSIVPAATAAAALETIFGVLPLAEFFHAGSEPAKREELSAALFEMVLPGRAMLASWAPLARAAGVALAWPDLTDEQEFRLRFARAVAARHEGRAGDDFELDEMQLSLLPEPVRTDVLAHWVQESADKGAPDPATARRLALPRLVDGAEATPANLRLRGALGRLALAEGILEEACEQSLVAARGLVDRFLSDQVSHSLCAAAVAAGGLGDLARLEEARVLRAAVESRSLLDDESLAFLDLAFSRAGVLINDEVDGAIASLSRLASDAALRDHLRHSARRWWGRALALRGDAEGARSVREALGSPRAEPFATLAELDAALEQGDSEAAEAALASLVTIEPAARLQAARAGDRPSGADLVSRAYPY